MPFTVSHAAAALPVRRILPILPLDALIAGTMSPDFDYVLRLAVAGGWWHTPAGLVVACVPASLAVVWIWRVLVRPALLPLLPAGMRPEDSPAASPRAASLAIAAAAVAALLGAVTHVLWDGFTHGGGWAVLRFPALAEPALALGIDRPWYNLLQHFSTLAGGAILLLWLVGWIRRHPAEARRFAPGQRTALIRTAVVLLAVATAASLANGSRAAGSGLEWMLGYAAVGGMAGLAAAATAYGLARRLWGG
jgi:hypothetical protein